MWNPSKVARGRRDARDERLRSDALLFGAEHDRRAVRVVGADVKDLVALHAQGPHPDIRLDILHVCARGGTARWRRRTAVVTKSLRAIKTVSYRFSGGGDSRVDQVAPSARAQLASRYCSKRLLLIDFL